MSLPPPDFNQINSGLHLIERKKLLELGNSGDMEAMFEYGTRLRVGISVPKDEELGWKWIVAAAQRGHPVAQGYCYREGMLAEKNLERAVDLFRRSADLGHPSGISSSMFALEACLISV
jgi:TPR repeat protein